VRISGFRHKGLKRLYQGDNPRGVRADLVAKIEDIMHAIEQASTIE
jgi:plasmid maintenance system killer protein